MRKTYIIAFAGVDGAGKTTQAKLLAAGLSKRYADLRVRYAWNRWDPFCLEPLRLLWKSRMRSECGCDNRASEEKKRRLLRNPFVRNLWITLFMVDYFFQILLKVKIPLLFFDCLILDRSYLDSFIDQAVNLGMSPDDLARVAGSRSLQRLLYKPDIVFFMDVSVEIAKARAPGMDREYVAVRSDFYKRMSILLQWVRLDGGEAEHEIEQDILKKVTHELS